MTKVSVVIPLYFNQLELYPIISKCLSNLKFHYPQAEVVIVDDCSPIDTEEWRELADIFLHHPTNTGYTKSVTHGLDIAHGDVLVVMNDDIMLKRGDLDRYFGLKVDDLGIWSPKTSEEGPGDLFGSIWGLTWRTYQEMGPLCPTLPHFFSDKEYYDRAQKMGIPVYKWKDITVKHLGGATYKHENKQELYERDFASYTEAKNNPGLDRQAV